MNLLKMKNISLWKCLLHNMIAASWVNAYPSTIFFIMKVSLLYTSAAYII